MCIRDRLFFVSLGDPHKAGVLIFNADKPSDFTNNMSFLLKAMKAAQFQLLTFFTADKRTLKILENYGGRSKKLRNDPTHYYCVLDMRGI